MQALAAFELGDHEEASARCLEARDAADAIKVRDERHVQRAGPLFILANIAMSIATTTERRCSTTKRSRSLGVPEKRGAWALLFQ